VITRSKKPVAKRIAVEPRGKQRVPGRLKDLISWQPDAFAPLSDSGVSELGFE